MKTVYDLNNVAPKAMGMKVIDLHPDNFEKLRGFTSLVIFSSDHIFQ